MVYRLTLSVFVALIAFTTMTFSQTSLYNIRAYGATGDGVSLDSPAIQAAIEAASLAGGGTVWFPAGVYASYTLRLKSNVTLHLDAGATLLAAYPDPEGTAGYDLPEANKWGDLKYQDFGHSRFRNSLIWGDGLENVSIVGQGRIDGLGLVGAHHVQLPGEEPSPYPKSGYRLAEKPGQGNKAIALVRCRNVTLRDFSIFRGGHFAIIGTGVDNLTIDNLKVDTNRDGFDIDSCRNVHITNCSVNSPHDDAIVLKTSYALGELRHMENVTIANCHVSGYSIGTLLDGTYDRSFTKATDGDGPTGRIKIGTESNGDFRNIAITNCVFDRCRGLALESVDGANIEDITISNLTMRDIVNAPFFLRLGNRARGPEGTTIGSIRRVSISHINVYDADARYASQIVGEPGHPIEDVRFESIRIAYKGGLALAQIAEQPKSLVNPFFLSQSEPGVTGPRDPYAVPERPKAYPEPSMFGLLPAYGFYVRHASNVSLDSVSISLLQPDERHAFVLDDVRNIVLRNLALPEPSVSKLFHFTNVTSFSLRDSLDLESILKTDFATGER